MSVRRLSCDLGVTTDRQHVSCDQSMMEFKKTGHRNINSRIFVQLMTTIN